MSKNKIILISIAIIIILSGIIIYSGIQKCWWLSQLKCPTGLILTPEILNYEKGEADEKYCKQNKDCTIKYNVNYQGECLAGCFNKETKFDEWCDSNMLWEAFSPDSTCTCQRNKCEMINLQ